MKLDMNWNDYLPLRRLKAQMGIQLDPLQGPGWGDTPPPSDMSLAPTIAVDERAVGNTREPGPEHASPGAK